MMLLVVSSTTFPLNLGMYEGGLVSMVGQARSWAIGSLINFLKSGKLRPSMYGKHGRGVGTCAIVAMWGEWCVVAFGCGVPTNNDLVNVTPIKEVKERACLPCLCDGAGRESTPPKMGGRNYSRRENWCGSELTIVTISLCRRECGMLHKKLNTFSKLRQMQKYDVHIQ